MKTFVFLTLLLLLTLVFAQQGNDVDLTQLTPEEKLNFIVVKHVNKPVNRLKQSTAKFLKEYSNYVTKFNQVGHEIVQQLKNETNSLTDSKASASAISLDLILNLAAKGWKFIQDNKAVYEPSKLFGNALPKGATAFDLYGWSSPVTATFNDKWKNLFGMTVCNLEYTLSFIPGGKFKDANGNVGTYLDRITIIPTDVFVMWGFKATAEVSISSVTNAGTQNKPVAAAIVDLTFSFQSLNKEVLTHSFYVRADGYWKQLH
jgi:hypothetical protein